MSTPLLPDGLFRTRLAGRFSRTTEAFHTLRGAKIGRASCRERVSTIV